MQSIVPPATRAGKSKTFTNGSRVISPAPNAKNPEQLTTENDVAANVSAGGVIVKTEPSREQYSGQPETGPPDNEGGERNEEREREPDKRVPKQRPSGRMAQAGRTSKRKTRPDPNHHKIP
jgi:hypothetical protein